MSLTRVIKEQAYASGFSLVGITTPDPLPHADVFERWLDDGRQAGMAYMNTERSRTCRPHPGLLFPECRSVITLGVRYPRPLLSSSSNFRVQSPRGRVAAYAWGKDYHLVLPERLQRLVAFIEAQVGQPVSHRTYTDTGPLLERELAQRAGLGWIGKNTCLINPRAGSYFLLAEVLMGIELEPDPPFTQDRCGTCRRCMDACPTGCILPDRTLDARRCISYLTIELKGPIPPDLRVRMGSWVFGCDLCQQVCPWNRFASAGGDRELEPRLAGAEPDLLAEMALDEADFKQKYRTSPLMRARRRGYLRNVAVALGNSHCPEAIPSLGISLQSDPEPLVRGHAAWAMGQVGGEAARQALEAAALVENDHTVKLEIQASLDAWGGN